MISVKSINTCDLAGNSTDTTVFLVLCGVIALFTKLMFWVTIAHQMFNGGADEQGLTIPILLTIIASLLCLQLKQMHGVPITVESIMPK